MECGLTDQRDEASLARQASIRLWEEAGDPVRTGDGWRELACGYRNSGRGADSVRAANRAVEILEPLGPGPELAWAYAQQCGLSMAHDPDALTRGEKALALAEQIRASRGGGACPALRRVDEGGRR